MINIPLPMIKEKILEKTDVTEEELTTKIKEKLDQLSGLISEEGAAHIIANELGVKLFQTSGKLEIKNVLVGMRDVEVLGKVARKFEVRTFNTGERSGKVGSFILADNTGTIRVTLWNDQADSMEKVKEGDTAVIKSAYVRSNNGKNELHLNDRSELLLNPKGVEIDVDIETAGVVRKKLTDLAETDDNVEVLATIVQAFEPRFFEVCPGCGKRAKQVEGGYECRTHGIVKEPDYAYVMNLFLDDGSDNIRTVLWREQTSKLLGMTDEEVLKFKDNPTEFEPLKNDLLGTIVKVSGRVNKNEAFERLELVANTIITDPDPAEEIAKLKEAATTETTKTTDTTDTETATTDETTDTTTKTTDTDTDETTIETTTTPETKTETKATLKKTEAKVETVETTDTTETKETNEPATETTKKKDTDDLDIEDIDFDEADLTSIDEL